MLQILALEENVGAAQRTKVRRRLQICSAYVRPNAFLGRPDLGDNVHVDTKGIRFSLLRLAQDRLRPPKAPGSRSSGVACLDRDGFSLVPHFYAPLNAIECGHGKEKFANGENEAAEDSEVGRFVICASPQD